MTINPDGRRQSEGASASQIGLSQAEPVARLGPSGFDPSRYLTLDEATAQGYLPIYARDDGCVQSMMTKDGYRVTYGAPSYMHAAYRAHNAAIAMEARRGETPKSGSTAEGGDSAGAKHIAQPQSRHD